MSIATMGLMGTGLGVTPAQLLGQSDDKGLMITAMTSMGTVAPGLARSGNSVSGLPITPTALEAVHQAIDSQDYDIRFLTKERDGKPWLLILTGESHVKNKKASELGKALISHFSLRGLENSNVSKLWLGRIESTLRKFRSRLLRAIDFEKNKFGSTIDDACDLVEIQPDMILRNIKVFANIDLEFGHEPDIYENLASIYELALIVSIVPSACYFGLILLGFSAVPISLAIPGAVLTAPYLIGAGLARYLDPLSRWRPILSPTEASIVGRNVTMAASIENAHAHETLRVYSSMLALVGGAHIHGMVSLLTRQHGFEEIEIPPLDR